MFLNKLNADEKVMFINLANHAAMANGVIDEEEVKLMKEYCKEMDVSYDAINPGITMERIIDFLRQAEKSHQRIILFELIGLMYAEGEFDDDEKRFVLDFSGKVGISRDELAHQISLVNRYMKVLQEISQVVL